MSAQGRPAPAAGADAEAFIQSSIDSAPEPLRRLGEWLARTLDEDQWKTAERMLLGAATRPAAPLSEVATDAGRYRWMRDRSNSLETQQRDRGIVNGPSCYHDVGCVRELKSGAELDAAIDAARLAALRPTPSNERG